MTDKAVTRTPFVATRRQILAGGAAFAAVGITTARATSAQAATPTTAATPASGAAAATSPGSRHGGGSDRGTIQRWSRDTWASMVAMTDPRTGCPPTT